MVDFLDFLGCIYFDGTFGALIIPKWLIKVPGHIPIFFRTFLELPKCSPNLASYTPYLSPKYFKTYKKQGGNILKTYFLHLNILIIQNFQKHDTTGHQTC